MPVRWIASNATYANSFVYENVLIDAGVLPMAVEPYAAAIDTIVITHAHYDHIAHVKEIARLCGDAAVCIHEADAPGLADDARSLSMVFGGRSPGIVPDTVLADGTRSGALSSTCRGTRRRDLPHIRRQKCSSRDTVFTGIVRALTSGGDRKALQRR